MQPAEGRDEVLETAGRQQEGKAAAVIAQLKACQLVLRDMR